MDADEPTVERVPAWMRPGLAEYARRRQSMRELIEDLEGAIWARPEDAAHV